MTEHTPLAAMTVFEDAARQRKARAIALALRDHGATEAAARLLSPEARIAAATIADQRAPSAHTWNVVCNLLASMERGDRIAADLDDPWAGMPTSGDAFRGGPGGARR